MLRDSVVAVAVVRTRPRAIPLAMVTKRKSIHGFPLLSYMNEYGAPLGGPSGRRSFTIIKHQNEKRIWIPLFRVLRKKMKTKITIVILLFEVMGKRKKEK